MADIKDNKDGTRTVTVTVREGFDEGLLNALVSQMEKGTTNFVVGNIADLQRAGAAVVAAGQGSAGKGSGFAAGVALNPSVDADEAKAGAQRTLDAEAEAKAAPEDVAPAKNTEVASVDPTSVSPEPANK